VVSRLSATLVSRLVLNLHEQNATLTQLPTTIETEEMFRAALPVALEPLTVENPPELHPNNSIYETVAVDAFGTSY